MSAAQKLEILLDGELVSEMEVSHEVSLGRGEDNVIRLEDRAVSRKHAVIQPIADGLQVLKKSRFGMLLVNGTECASAVLKSGDLVQIGPFHIRVGERSGASASAVPSASPALTDGIPLLQGDASFGDSLDLPPQEPAVEALEDPLAGLDSPAETPIELGGLQEALPETDLPPLGGEPSLEGGVSLDSENADANGAVGFEAPGDTAPVSAEGLQAAQDAIENFSIGDPVPGGGGAPSPVEFDSGASDGSTSLISMGSVKVTLLFKPGSADVLEYEMTGDEIVIGRGKDCDVVLTDKRSSRKHALLKRQGAILTLRDLNSANGTFVDGRQITEETLEGEHTIKMGDAEFTFKAVHSKFEEQAAAIEAVSAPSLDSSGAFSQPPTFTHSAIPMPPASYNSPEFALGQAQVATAQPKSLLAKFRALPKRKQWVYTAVMVAIAFELFWDEAPKKPVQDRKVASQGKDKSAQKLTQAQLKFLEEKHKLAYDKFKQRQYDDTLSELAKIFAIVPEYKNSRELERYAIEGKRLLETQAEERRRREEENQRKARIETLLTMAQRLMDQKDYEKAKELFAEILSLDPENTLIPRWQAIIDQYLEEIRRKDEMKRLEAERKDRAREFLVSARAKRAKKDYWGAIADYESIESMEIQDAGFMRPVKREIDETMAMIDAELKPVLAQAKELESSGDVAQAYKLFEKATEIHPGSSEGLQGMERIKGLLHEKAKVLYVEGVLAESYSDFDVAKKKFKDCRSIAPKEDEYFAKASQRLRKYELMEQKSWEGAPGSLDLRRLPASDAGSSDSAFEGGGE